MHPRRRTDVPTRSAVPGRGAAAAEAGGAGRLGPGRCNVPASREQVPGGRRVVDACESVYGRRATAARRRGSGGRCGGQRRAAAAAGGVAPIPRCGAHQGQA
eukprot:365441-Chlamydomonas_euryale.AAC.1